MSTSYQESGLWEIKQFNRQFNQFFTVYEKDGSTQKNVSGYTVLLKVQRRGTTYVSAEVTKASASLGYVYHTVGSGDFPIPGFYSYELELTRGNEKVETYTYNAKVDKTL